MTWWRAPLPRSATNEGKFPKSFIAIPSSNALAFHEGCSCFLRASADVHADLWRAGELTASLVLVGRRHDAAEPALRLRLVVALGGQRSYHERLSDFIEHQFQATNVA